MSIFEQEYANNNDKGFKREEQRMKLSYMKCLGGALMVGIAVGAVGISAICSSRGMKGARRNAKRAMHAMGDLVDSVKHIIS